MEFAGTILVALWGSRSRRNLVALSLAVAGVTILIDVRWAGNPAGLFWALANAVLFVGSIVLGHRIAAAGAGSGVERLGAAMAIAFLVVLPVGIVQAARAFGSPMLVLAGIGVGLCSSVIPYVTDQLAMSRLPRATFALMLSLLPAMATIIGAIVLGQVPGTRDITGICLVMAGVALLQPAVQSGETSDAT
jgi:inner membrane transporter RhtA